MEQVCSRVGVICLQRGFEARKPMLRVRRRVCLLSLGDVHHWLRVGWAFRVMPGLVPGIHVFTTRQH